MFGLDCHIGRRSYNCIVLPLPALQPVLFMPILAATLVTTIALPSVRKVLLNQGFLDVSSKRSLHFGSVPRGAGAAILMGLVAGVLVGGDPQLFALGTLAGFTALGAWDDVHSRSAPIRLALQISLALIAGLMLSMSVDGVLSSRLTVAILAALVLVASVNVVNFMDGINGISLIHGVILGLIYTALLSNVGASEWVPLGLALAGASLAFAPWNFRRHALLFLGDSGSYLIGAAVALLILATWINGAPILVALAPCAVYLFDVGITLVHRLLNRQRLTQPHRDHIYQRLTLKLDSHLKSSLLVGLLTLICGAAAIADATGVIGSSELFAVVLCTLIIYAISPSVLRLRSQ